MAGPSEFAIVGTLRDWDVTDRLGEIHVPVLITCGEHDEMRPAHAKDMRRRMPNAELEVFADASHLAMAEVPEAYRASQPVLRPSRARLTGEARPTVTPLPGTCT